MGKKIKLYKTSFVSEDGHIVNPEAKKPSGEDNLQKTPIEQKPAIQEPKPQGKPLEDFHPESIADTLTAMHETAALSAGRAKGDNLKIEISAIKKINAYGLRCFSISFNNKGYAIFQLDSDIYYKPLADFMQTIKDLKDKVPGITVNNLKMQYSDPAKPLQNYNVSQREDCLFIVASIFSTLTGKSYCETKHSVSENCKIIKHNKLGTDGLVKNSLMHKEAKYGTEDENNFKLEIEDKQKQEPSVVGCLDKQPQEENVTIRKNVSNDISDAEQPNIKPALPNVNRKVHESLWAPLPDDEAKNIVWNGNDYIWEPGDYVFVRIWHNSDKRKRQFSIYRGQVTAANDPVNEEDSQDVVILVMGHTMVFDSADIAPDMTIEVQRNRFRDTSGELVDQAYEKGSGDYSNESDEAYLDHNNDKYMYGHIAYQGNRLTFAPVKINLTDISESKKMIRVINEGQEEPTEVSVEYLDTDVESWPWAIVVDADNPDADKAEEPVRKIKVNPTDFVKADADSDGAEGLVQCLVGDKLTKMLKKHIKVLS